MNSIKLSGNNPLVRDAIHLQGYKFKILHKKGSTNNVADYLSRNTAAATPTDIKHDDVIPASVTEHCSSSSE